MSNKIRNPQPGGGPDIVIPKLGWLFLGCSIGFYYVAWEIYLAIKFLLFMWQFHHDFSNWMLRLLAMDS